MSDDANRVQRHAAAAWVDIGGGVYYNFIKANVVVYNIVRLNIC